VCTVTSFKKVHFYLTEVREVDSKTNETGLLQIEGNALNIYFECVSKLALFSCKLPKLYTMEATGALTKLPIVQMMKKFPLVYCIEAKLFFPLPRQSATRPFSTN
jgi:hypothetical protein